MEIRGYLSEFPFPDILRFVDQTQKQGYLKIQSSTATRPTNTQIQVWFDRGYIVAAAKPSRLNGLFWLIHEQGWLNYYTTTRLAQTCPINTPIGLYLKSQNALKANQLQTLFWMQVMGAVQTLFQLDNGWFEFDTNSVLPYLQMTGLKLPAYDVCPVISHQSYKGIDVMDALAISSCDRPQHTSLSQLE